MSERSHRAATSRCVIIFCVLVTAACGGGSDITTNPPPPPATPTVASVALTAPRRLLSAGEEVQFTATAKDAQGAAVSGATITWTSSASAIATVDATGKVHGASGGTAIITAAASSQQDTATVTVRDTTSLPAVLAGEIRRVNLSIPAGETHHVSGATALIADSTVTIDGTLDLDPGASLLIFGSLVQLNGTVQPSPEGGLRAAVARSRWSALQVDLPPGNAGVVGKNVVITGTLAAQGEVVVTGGKVPGDLTSTATITIQGQLLTGDGVDGTKASPNGTSAQSIWIGKPSESATAEMGLRVITPISSAVVFQTAIGSGEGPIVRAGRGGNGFSIVKHDDAQVLALNELRADAGSGGSGGEIYIFSTTTIGTVGTPQPDIQAGNAGLAGNVMLEGAEKLHDGSGPGGAGESITARAGAAGGWGQFRPDPPNDAPSGFDGEAATPGWIQLEGGNGQHGGPGGTIIARVFDPTVLDDFNILFSHVDIHDAANGGASDNKDLPGGNGGTVVVSSRNDEGKAAILDHFSLSRVANGGAGFNGCTTFPLTAGTKGGTGGVRYIGGSNPNLNDPIQTFWGGNGGDGLNAAGDGGAQGTDADKNEPLGIPGVPGNLCSTYLVVSGFTGYTSQVISRGTPCLPPPPNPDRNIVVSSPLPAEVGFNVQVVDVSGSSGYSVLPNPLDPGTSTRMFGTTAPPNGQVTIGVYHDFCSAPEGSYSTQIILYTTDPDQPIKIITINGSISQR